MSAGAFANPRVGVAAIVRNRDGQLLFGQRLSSHGHGTWQFPGGHLEYGETFFACAEREVLEETALRVRASKLVGVTNCVFEDAQKHYITLFILCQPEDPASVPQNLEPEKCSGWSWVDWADIRDWCSQHDDDDAAASAKKCFLPIVHLARDYPDLDLATCD